ncbi:hypothetical protein [Pelagicoccus sp. SDUM812003]|uniref:hypothetical protein n=1 Tax=Pelagicoccus sp. SDUM812003 TaxID=3041267 RepID=UPI002810118F|nr:hypothetical protein [Pelagicoccus sp. SDUM812003]MDQ8203031.1 hypothetical protein [Pelagicoccus sp. SDUM812003]
MNEEPVIAFGQQPCGFFPKRFLVSKIWTAKRLQKEIGGRVVFFYHDCDHDPRETQTILFEADDNTLHRLNFAFENKLQKKYSPLYLKRVSREWQDNMARQLPKFVRPELVELFRSNEAENVADFCLEMYRGMGLLNEVEVLRSGSSSLREKAIEVDDFFIDTPYQGEVVRARKSGDRFVLHQGGDSFLEVPVEGYEKRQVTPTRDTRLRWMQSALRCTHYVAGASEINYLNTEETPEITFVERDFIERADEAYVGG